MIEWLMFHELMSPRLDVTLETAFIPGSRKWVCVCVLEHGVNHYTLAKTHSAQ